MVITSAAGVTGVLREQASEARAGSFTGQSSYGTELRAGVASAEANVQPATLLSIDHASRSAGGQPPWRERVGPDRCKFPPGPTVTPADRGTIGVPPGGPGGPVQGSRGPCPSDGFGQY